jgi:hypothetical protein
MIIYSYWFTDKRPRVEKSERQERKSKSKKKVTVDEDDDEDDNDDDEENDEKSNRKKLKKRSEKQPGDQTLLTDETNRKEKVKLESIELALPKIEAKEHIDMEDGEINDENSNSHFDAQSKQKKANSFNTKIKKNRHVNADDDEDDEEYNDYDDENSDKDQSIEKSFSKNGDKSNKFMDYNHASNEINNSEFKMESNT